MENLPFDTMQYRVKEGKHYSVVETKSPTERAIDVAEYILLVIYIDGCFRPCDVFQCMGDLACKQDTREFLTEHCCESVIIALEVTTRL